jgi:hypothetical protein
LSGNKSGAIDARKDVDLDCYLAHIKVEKDIKLRWQLVSKLGDPTEINFKGTPFVMLNKIVYS